MMLALYDNGSSTPVTFVKLAVVVYREIGVFTLAEEANCVFTLLFVTL